MKPGWKTTEFWQAAVAQGLALFTILGTVTANDAKTLGDSMANCITAVFALIANGWVVIHYIRGRFTLKDNQMRGNTFTQLPLLLISTVGLALLLGGPSTAQAQLLPWRSDIIKQIQQHDRQINQMIGQNKSQPQQPILLMPANPPQQQFPIQGQPQQSFPIGGQPQQQLPIQGQPQQQLPIQGAPQQQLPIQGQPQQGLPIQGPPQQQMPPAQSLGPQAYSINRAPAQPIP